MSPLQPAFHSYSLPTSPTAPPRSSKSHPVTPQRLPRDNHRQTQSFYRSPITPSTPYTPLSLRSATSNNSSILTTPDNHNHSLDIKKSVSYVSGSPDNLRQEKSFADVAGSWRSRASDNGIKVSSIDQNHPDDQPFGDDEGTEYSVSDSGNDSSILAASDVLLPSFLSKQPAHQFNHAPSRPRTQSHSSFQPRPLPSSPTLHRNAVRTQPPPPVSPLRTRHSQNQPLNLLSTPPPNRTLAKQMKLKGSVTDPAHTRRREAFGVIRAPQNTHTSFNLGYPNDVSMGLFDIDENENEQDTNHDIPHEDESFSINLQAHQANTFGYLNYTYPSFPQYNSDPFQSTGIQFGYPAAPSNIADSVELHFHSLQQQQQQRQNVYNYNASQPQPAKTQQRDTSVKVAQNLNTPTRTKPAKQQVPIPSGDLSLPVIHKPTPLHPASRNANSMILPSTTTTTCSDLISLESPPPSFTNNNNNITDCAVCLVQNPPSLAILKPCDHPLCSACLTSALNIVGEKDMECAVCKQSVQDFKIVNPRNKAGFSLTEPQEATTKAKSFFGSTTPSSPTHSLRSLSKREGSTSPLGCVGDGAENNDSFGDLENSFDFGIDFSPHEIRASTPKLVGNDTMRLESGVQQATVPAVKAVKGNLVVLRIDNVPWDITPSHVVTWLQQPIERVHVLLDSKGKTLSHAYVEVQDQRIAGAILRGEALLGADGKRRERGSVLGKGRRARGVTITRSSQGELMADLFPHWKGSFDGTRPSLAGLQKERVIDALGGCVLTENELTGLLYLIREPDSHFLKVPSLPFHSLISILSKFPSDMDSRVFWSVGIRDMLFDVTFAAIETLLARLEMLKGDIGVSPKVKNDHGYSMDLAVDLVQTALHCQAFTDQQIHKLACFAASKAIPLSPTTEAFSSPSSSSSPACTTTPPINSVRTLNDVNKDLLPPSQPATRGDPFGELAKEFGVEAGLVQALAQRLANLA